MKRLSRVISVFDRIIDGSAIAATLLVAFVMITICIEVVTRYTGYTQRWTIEVVEYTLLYITFLGTAWVLKIDGHVRVDLVTNLLTSKAQAVLGVIASLIGIIISLVLVIYGSMITWELFITEKFLSTQLLPPAAPLYIIIPIGSIFLLLQFVRKTYDSVIKYRQPSR